MDVVFIIAILLFVAGFILVGVEMIIPGFSVPGISGIICLIVGIFLTADSIQEGIIITLVIMALLGIMFSLILSLLSKGKIKSPIILKEEQKTNLGYISSSDLQYLLGKKGEATTDLRPVGMANFDGVELDVMSESKYLEKGTKLVIDKVKGSKLIVKELK